MALAERLRLARRLPLRVVVGEGAGVLARRLGAVFRRARDRRRGTRAAAPAGGEFARFFPPLGPDATAGSAARLARLTARDLAHEFDLLGSGRVRVAHDTRPAGLEGHRYEMAAPIAVDAEGVWLARRLDPGNRASSQAIWRLVEGAYAPIDWQLDFKSGYRWSEATWYRDIRFGHLAGVDVKVPWELARMQHLPRLAQAYGLAKAGDAGIGEAMAPRREFRNQVIDFIAANPPRFGVNWCCAMEVAIRLVNWLVAHDLFRAHGAVFDAPFERALGQSAVEHARHVAAHLEWRSGLRNNHYLADVLGLLFAGAYLPGAPEADAWLRFAIPELMAEIEHQFGTDGANFEASTCYHRLSAEMAVYGAALVLGLPAERWAGARAIANPAPAVPALRGRGARRWLGGPGADEDRTGRLPAGIAERIERMAEFVIHATKPNGRMAQIGDNDSGRLLKLCPSVGASAPGAGDDSLDHRHLVAAADGLFGRADFAAFAGPSAEETAIVRALAGGVRLESYRAGGRGRGAEAVRVGDGALWHRFEAGLAGALGDRASVWRRAFAGADLRAGLELFGYADFGLYLFRSRRLYLAIRCGALAARASGAHAHNDQLALELCVDGEDLIADPGSYLYTPLPARRNEYRSVRAHFAPRVGAAEPARLDLGLFALLDAARAECLYFGPEGFIGRHRGFGRAIHRRVAIGANHVEVADFEPAEKGGWRLVPLPEWRPPPFSPGYGLRL